MQRTKPTALLALLAGALGALGSWTQEWFSFTINEGAATSTVGVSGTLAAPLVSSAALGLLAGITVLLIGQHVMRLVVAVIMIAVSALGIGSIMSAMSNTVEASRLELSRVTGVADTHALSQLVATGTMSVWPTLCLASLVIAIVGAVVVLGFSVNWKSSGSRYARPESPRTPSTPNVAPASATKNRRRIPAEVHDGDSWDSLTKGADPTR